MEQRNLFSRRRGRRAMRMCVLTLGLALWTSALILVGCQRQQQTGAAGANAAATTASPTTSRENAGKSQPVSAQTVSPPTAATPSPPEASAVIPVVKPGARVWTADNPLSGADLDGVQHVLGQYPATEAIVVVMLGTTCPISNKFVPELNRLAAAAKDQHVEFYGLMSATPPYGVTRAEAQKHHADYHLAFPVLFDTTGELCERLTPTHTPDALVLSPNGVLRYRGRIDDRFVALGQEREQITRHDLAEAIAAVRAGKMVDFPQTDPVGCVVEARARLQHMSAGAATASAPLPTQPVTFNREIAPILQQNCAVCHHAGEVAPFPLTNYAETLKHAQQVADVTHAKIMPPWQPKQGFGHFQNERRLTDREIDLIQAWVRAGSPEGDPADLPPSVTYQDGWRLGKPDLILKATEAYTLPAEGRDVYRCFVVPSGLLEDKYIAAVDFRPGNPRVVHHAILYIDTHGAAREKDAADPGPGYSSFGGPGFLPSGSLGGWAPGATAQYLPDGMARLMPKGADLAMQIHYNLSGKVETDQSEVALYFAKTPVQNVITGLPLVNRKIDIPAGEKRHREAVTFTTPVPVTVIGIFPHMHLIGSEIKVTATTPDGKVEPLLWIERWDFNWQDQFLYREPLQFPKGTVFNVEAWYDNSTDNERNPHNPPVRVRWGEQTADEMLFCPLLITTESDADLRTLRGALLKQLLVGGGLARIF